jgi:hypothetical protein
MHILLAVAQGKIHVDLPRVLSRAQYRGGFFVMRAVLERNTVQFLSKVFAAESIRSGSI